MSTPKYVELYDLHTPAQLEAAERSRQLIEAHGINAIRIVWPDQHGLMRGKVLTKEAYFATLKAGMDITMAPFFFDSANAIVLNPFSADGGFPIEGLGGSPNIKMVPDPGTFKILPWATDTAIVISDLYMGKGQLFPFAPRSILKQTLQKMADNGYRLITGIEMEWYLTRLVDNMLGNCSLGAPGSPADPPKVAPVTRGYSYLLIDHLDEIDDILRPISRALSDMGLPLRSTDDEWAPSQIETTFDILEALEGADAAFMIRMAIKQIAKREGYVASFMCTPAIDGFYANGWHLHTSVTDLASGENLMVPGPGEVLSDLGRHYVGGSLEHGIAASVFTTPTINGYRRRRPYSLAPDRLTWAMDNRAAMMRVISAPNDVASHVENRVGDPAANPYLYIAAQAAAGLDGILNKTEPGVMAEDPYAQDVAQLPTTLEEALECLEADTFFRAEFGDGFIDYMATVKRSEITRYNEWVTNNPDPETYVNGVTDWEHREYFELY